MKFCKCTRPRGIVFMGFALLLALGAFQPGKAADAAAQPVAAGANRFAAAIAPLERFEIDGVLVERHGAASGRPLILIPGLASGSWVWQDTIRAFGAEHPLYVLTLPGFDGRPPAGPAPFALTRAAVAKLIESRNLARPVIVGHSLGGILGFALAEDKPALVGGVISIDGLPVMPGSEDFTPAQRVQFAENMRARVANASPDAFAGQQQAYMRTIGVLDMGKADDLARLSGRSDPKSVGQYVADVLNLDLRPGLKTIQAPVLVLAPYFDLDASQRGLQEATVADYYRALLEGTPRLQVTTVSPARHFAMIDEPEKVEDAIRAYLKSL
jgi:pimeloyl-ACP methyl ester carboxylesterase